MISWVIALITLAAEGIIGFYQGALRMAFAFLGVIIAALVVGPLTPLFKSMLGIFGMKNLLFIALLAPLLAFLLVVIAVKCVAFAIHRKAETWYKYRASDTHRLLWERCNARAGVSVGLLAGVAYFFAFCTAVNLVGYLTLQVANPDKDTWSIRTINYVYESMTRVGLDKAVAPFMPKSELYYDGADIVSDIVQTPLLQNRLANYPPLLTLAEKPAYKPLSDPAFQGEWIKGMSFGQFVSHEKIKPLLEDRAVVTEVLALLSGDLKDLKTYLETGKSPKYDEEKILGRWLFDYKASVNLGRRKKPNMGSADIKRLRTLLQTSFVNGVFTATVDNRAILKLPSASKGNIQGGWRAGADGKYLLNLGEGAQDLEVQIEGRHLIFIKDTLVLVFQNLRV